MKIAIVNDLKIAQEILKRVISNNHHELIWTAWDGNEAVEKAIENTPDIILMDLIMPNVSGVESTRLIMEKAPCAIIIVTATVQGNSNLVYEAMGYGAIDAVKTPVLGENNEIQGGAILLEKIEHIGRILGKVNNGLPKISIIPITTVRKCPEIILIGASTGGPQALVEIFSKLPKNFPTPIVVTQHVDAEFAPGLASWLNNLTPLNVQIAAEGSKPEKGNIYIAGTRDHLVYLPDGSLHYSPEPLDMIYRPSVDALFKSYAKYSKSYGIAILLTGMGQDGAEGMLMLRNKGWHTIAQDKKTSVLFNMPKAAIDHHAAMEILPLKDISQMLLSLLNNPEKESALTST